MTKYLFDENLPAKINLGINFIHVENLGTRINADRLLAEFLTFLKSPSAILTSENNYAKINL